MVPLAIIQFIMLLLIFTIKQSVTFLDVKIAILSVDMLQ